jgi:hypothetical protein
MTGIVLGKHTIDPRREVRMTRAAEIIGVSRDRLRGWQIRKQLRMPERGEYEQATYRFRELCHIAVVGIVAQHGVAVEEASRLYVKHLDPLVMNAIRSPDSEDAKTTMRRALLAVRVNAAGKPFAELHSLDTPAEVLVQHGYAFLVSLGAVTDRMARVIAENPAPSEGRA